ncbi:MAG: hypothetical protein HY924_06000 [Elusimicrobia bacterium]|nr:hypothetical protein [Elusimicrobiota bacterium]
MRRGVLLVEFVTSDLFPGLFEDSLPFFKGFLNRHGVPNRWLRFALGADNPFRHGRDEVTLSEPEFRGLVRAAKELRAGAAFFTHPLFRRQRLLLAGKVPGLETAVWTGGLLLARDLMARLGLPLGPEGFHHEDVLTDPEAAADYRWEPGNAAASAPGHDVVYLYTGSDCAYRRPVAGNPCYAGVSLPPSAHAFGCAFCGDRQDRPAPGPTVSAAWIEKQIRDLTAGRRPGQRPAALVLPDVGDAELLAKTMASMRRRGMGKTPLLMGVRLDRLLRVRPALEDLLAGMSKGESIHCVTVGAENFAADELRRFNKGFEPLTVVRGINLLKELEASQGGRFLYSGYKPLAVILLTPWTRPCDLAYNLRLIRHFKLEDEAGNLFSSRLRLHPELPITSLAAKDGLLGRTPDRALAMARRRLERSERGWRFKDPRMEPVNSLAGRLERSPSLAGDRLYEDIQKGLAWTERDKGQLTDILLASARLADSSPKPIPAEKLFESSLAAWRAGPAPLLPGKRLGLELLGPAEYVERCLALVHQGPRAALSLEGLPPAAELKGLARTGPGLHAKVVERGPASTLYAARDAKTLERLIRLESGPKAKQARASTISELGKLYGYPSCCVRAWLKNPWRQGGFSEWLALLTRAASPGPCPGLHLPLLVSDLAFIPCSAQCRAAEAACRSWFKALGGSLTAKALSDRVFVHSLLDRADGASFIPGSRQGRVIRYDPSSVTGTEGGVAAWLRKGDRLEQDCGQVSVFRGEKALRRWVAEAAVWDRQAMADPEFWVELAAAALRRSGPAGVRQPRLKHAHQAGQQLLLSL